MDIRAFRGLSGTYNVRASERDRGAPCNIECLVKFLNNTQHKFVLDRRSKGQCLLDSVFKHLHLIETDFFGLKYLPQESHSPPAASAPTAAPNHRHQKHHNNNTQQPPNNQTNNNNNNSFSYTNHNHSPTSNTSLSSSTATSYRARDSPSPPSPAVVVALSSQNNTSTSSSNSSTSGSTSQPCPIVANGGHELATNNNVASKRNNHIDINNTTTNCNHNHSATPDSVTPANAPSASFVEERWLDPTKSIRKQYKSGPPYEFYFRVKFYVSDPCKLADDTTRNHLYLQLRQDILNSRLVVPTCSAILLASYILQSEVGDYKQELQEENYASQFQLLPNQNEDIKKKVIELHKQHKSLSSADAEYQFLLHAAKKLDCYGVEFYDATDAFKTDVRIGVSSNGIVVFQQTKKMKAFGWSRIIKIMFKKKIFSIQLRREEGESCDNFVEYNLLSNQACKSFWEECVAQHSFFGLSQPKSPPKKFFSFLNFGSKFQYNGKTEYQTIEEMKKRSFSHFSRSLSKRYARRSVPIGRLLWNEADTTTTTTTDDKPPASSASVLQSNGRVVEVVEDNGKSSSNDQKNSEDARDSATTNTPSNSKRSNQTKTLAESIEDIRKGLEKRSDGKMDLIEEFEKLSRKNEEETLEESKLTENIDKNRYRDILPYDSTRVQLIDSMTGDYINASFVDMTVPSGVVNRYIATQGPLPSTCDDFWQMVWEQNCSLIIMVTPLIEAGRVKCHKYWPDEKEEIRYGQILVRNLNEKSKTATIGRTIQLVDVKSGEKRLTSQIQYKAWPDHEIPEDCGDFLKLVNRVRKHRLSKPKDPIIVHCSAGIGRTGVLILMETALCIMESGEPIFPIKILEDMRKQRAMLIQTNCQFLFVVDAICKVYDQKPYKKFRKRRKK